MKSYVAPNHVRLIGKAWEIRWKLAQWNKQFPSADTRLIDVCRRLSPAGGHTPRLQVLRGGLGGRAHR
jgi:hypothetical protein